MIIEDFIIYVFISGYWILFFYMHGFSKKSDPGHKDNIVFALIKKRSLKRTDKF